MRLPRLLVALLLLAGPAWAQAGEDAADSTRYQPATDERRVASVTDTTGTCTELLRWGAHQGLLRTYYPGGTLRAYEPYADVDRGLRHGNASEWYANGQLQLLVPYVGGLRRGMMLCYYEDGRLRRQTEYEAGRELPGLCYDEAGRPVPYFPYEQPPLYPGGLGRFTRELQRRVERALPPPRSVLGLVPNYLQLTFLVDERGRVGRPRVEVPSLVPGYDAAVLRELSAPAPPWLPGRRDDRPGTFVYRLRLPLGPRAGEGYLGPL